MTYAEFKARLAGLEAAAKPHAAVLKAAPRNRFGLTVDEAKTPEWRAAFYASIAIHRAIRALNGRYAKRFAKEIRADIAAKRMRAIRERTAA